MTESQRTQKVASFCMEMINKYTAEQDTELFIKSIRQK
jgi:hypothetical protein